MVKKRRLTAIGVADQRIREREERRGARRRLSAKEITEIVGQPDKHETLRQAVLDYISEYDNPVPDALHRRTLRNRLRELVGAPDEPAPRKPIHRRS